jgi:chromosome segregation ATPase
LLLAGTALPLSHAAAQTATTPARPAAKPAEPATKSATKPAAPAAPAAAADRTATLGGGTGTVSRQPILTRDELRECLSQEQSIRTRLAEHQGARAPLDRERDDIRARQDALRAERQQVDIVVARASEFRGRSEAHAQRVAQWNREMEAFNARPPSGSAGERERVRLNSERDALQKSQAELETERVALAADNERTVVPFNAKVKQVEAVVQEWNARNQAWNEAGARLEGDRKDWVAGCADRRYREDDEIAIRAGR